MMNDLLLQRYRFRAAVDVGSARGAAARPLQATRGSMCVASIMFGGSRAVAPSALSAEAAAAAAEDEDEDEAEARRSDAELSSQGEETRVKNGRRADR